LKKNSSTLFTTETRSTRRNLDASVKSPRPLCFRSENRTACRYRVPLRLSAFAVKLSPTSPRRRQEQRESPSPALGIALAPRPLRKLQFPAAACRYLHAQD